MNSLEYEFLLSELNNQNSPMLNLLNRDNLKITDIPATKRKKYTQIARSIYNSTYTLINKTDYLSYLGGGLRVLNETPFDVEIIRALYLSYFRWDIDLLKSLRLLCDKLFFKGESQFIDRILDSFSESWFQIYGIQNNKSLFGNPNGVYLVSYSLILLNTDLHSGEIEKKKKISKTRFLKNTITALRQGEVPFTDMAKLSNELKQFYECLSFKKLKLTGLENAQTSIVTTAQNETNNCFNSHRTANKRTSISSLSTIRSSVPQQHKIPCSRDSLSSGLSVGTSITNLTLTTVNNATPAKDPYGFANALIAERRLKRMTSTDSGRLSLNSNNTGHSNSMMILQGFSDTTYQSMLNKSSLTDLIIEEEGDLQLELQGPPWVKEGLQKVMLPEDIQLNYESSTSSSGFTSFFNATSNFKMKSKKWQNLFTVVSKGELKIFSFNSTTRDELVSLRGQGYGDWWNSAHCLVSFNMCSCFAQLVQSDSKIHQRLKTRYEPIVKKTGFETYWVLNLPFADGITKTNTLRKICFYAGTKETAKEFVDSCNFWASRTSAILPDESISSIEYGWSKNFTALLDSKRQVDIESYLATSGNDNNHNSNSNNCNVGKISEWSPMTSGLIPTNLKMLQQLRTLITFYFELKAKFRDHQRLQCYFDQLNEIYKKSQTSSSPLALSSKESSSGFYLTFNNLFNRSSRHSRESILKNIKLIKTNYINKLNYLDNELLRLKTYIKILKSAIELRSCKLNVSPQEERIAKQDTTDDQFDSR